MIKIEDDDVALIGKCVYHPISNLEVIQWRDKYYYFASSTQIHKWELDKLVYFFPDASHAFDVQSTSN